MHKSSHLPTMYVGGDQTGKSQDYPESVQDSNRESGRVSEKIRAAVGVGVSSLGIDTMSACTPTSELHCHGPFEIPHVSGILPAWVAPAHAARGAGRPTTLANGIACRPCSSGSSSRWGGEVPAVYALAAPAAGSFRRPCCRLKVHCRATASATASDSLLRFRGSCT